MIEQYIFSVSLLPTVMLSLSPLFHPPPSITSNKPISKPQARLQGTHDYYITLHYVTLRYITLTYIT
jgi:hypothetical protein